MAEFVRAVLGVPVLPTADGALPAKAAPAAAERSTCRRFMVAHQCVVRYRSVPALGPPRDYPGGKFEWPDRYRWEWIELLANAMLRAPDVTFASVTRARGLMNDVSMDRFRIRTAEYVIEAAHTEGPQNSAENDVIEKVMLFRSEPAQIR